MNKIRKRPLDSIGYDYIPAEYLPSGMDEYYIRNQQNKSGISYRRLTAYEIEVLVRNNNTSDDWNKIQVSDAFNPELVKNCKFYGLVRIGKLEPISLEYHNVILPVGLYNSTILSCDFGDNVVINNVNYLSHYIIGNEVMISNVHELHCTDHAKFGNGIIKEGEQEAVRVWVEVCNENAGRKILPFNGMLPGDAWLWAKHREDAVLMNKLKEFTEKKFDLRRGYYGEIGDRCVIKNTSIIKDVWIGSDAYIKGANKLKNLTINSSPEAHSQIGEGCELVNGIIEHGCRIFYGVKAVRFVMGSHSQLKYGARLINSYLGDNSTISCCEVLNSLIFPAHEQHHNNSFLCAALVMGQSNIAAGATIGSNHNSRAADGELVTARGFWPGLCVSLKHNSRFASFTLLAKGDYPAELNIALPFSLVSNDTANDRLIIMPGYWFLYNLYALARNSGKYADRDKRTTRVQQLEYDYLAPDSVNEIFNGLDILRHCTGQARTAGEVLTVEEWIIKGEEWLQSNHPGLRELTVCLEGAENSNRKVLLLKVKEAYDIYQDLVWLYGAEQLIRYIQEHQVHSFAALHQALPQEPERLAFVNIGGQLIPQPALDTLRREIAEDSISSWDEVHDYYALNGALYGEQKFQHAYASLLEIMGITHEQFNEAELEKVLQKALEVKAWMVKRIHTSREKDYENSFRQMVYNNTEEMEAVIGKLDENVFILQQEEELKTMQSTIHQITSRFRP